MTNTEHVKIIGIYDRFIESFGRIVVIDSTV